MNIAYYLLLSDLTMKTTTNSRQTSPHISYIHMHTLVYVTKTIHLHSSNEENSQNKKMSRSVRLFCEFPSLEECK